MDNLEKNDEQCYMRDMYTLKEVENLLTSKFENNLNWKMRKVNGIKYRDPDYNCKRLYADMNRIFFENKCVVSRDYNNPQQIILIHNDICMTSDYLGPSLTSMVYAGITNEEAWETILKCRIPGGHIVWPKIRNGINPSKAASGRRGFNISDRSDTALYEIKNFLDNMNDLPVYNKLLKESLNLEINKKWFGPMCFKDFCDRYLLKGSFVNDDYEIIWFADPKVEKVDANIMRHYMKNNGDAIIKRNERMHREMY